jgi:lysozyme family protein
LVHCSSTRQFEELLVNVDELIDGLIDREGGYVNHPSDRGGPTNFGITEAVARAHGFSGSMRNLPRSEAAAIYKRLYWLRPRFDQVAKRSQAVAAELFDSGVNMGPSVAATFLQRALSALNRDARIMPTSFRTAASVPLPCPRSTASSSYADRRRARRSS